METEINAFLSSLGEHSESTQLAYANDLRVFLLYLQQNLDHTPEQSDLNTQQVTGFLETERQRGRQRNTLIRRLATLKYFNAFLVREYQAAAASLSLDDHKLQSVLERVPARHQLQCLDKQQVASLLESMESSPRPRALRDRAMLMLMLESGLSVGILTALDMTDLDLRAERFHVNLVGKGDMWIPMGDAVGAVTEYISDGRPYLLNQPGEPALFISQMNGRLSRQGVWQILNHWGGTIDPPISLSPRILRHTAVLRMSMAGFSVTDIQVRLGHRNPLSTRALIRRLEAACTN